MGCGDEISKWDDNAVQDSLAGKNTGIDPKMLAEVMPEVEKAREERTIELLQENARNAREDLVERIGNEKPIDIELLDLAVEPTEKESHIMYQIAKELGLTDDYAIIDMPGIIGIKDPEAVLTESKVQELYEKGELKLGNIDDVISQVEKRVEAYHMDVNVMIPLMRETLQFLRDSKIPEEWRDQATVNNIVFVDRRDPLGVGEAARPNDLEDSQENLSRSRNVYVYQNENGRLLPQTEEERKDLQWTIAHEICHVNNVPGGKIDQKLFYPDGIAAVRAQLEAGPVSEYAQFAIEKCEGDFDKILGDPEFRADLYAAWVMDSPKLCPKTKEFLDKNFSE